MSNSETVNQSTKMVTGKVRFSYANVWEPKKAPGSDKAKYSVALLIPKKDKETVAKLNACIQAAIDMGSGSKFKAADVKSSKFKMPLRDGDKEKPGDPIYEGHYFVNATSDTQPGIVDSKVEKILDRTEFYSGCFGRASINFFPFNNVSMGIACGLNNVQKMSDGEALGGKSRAEDDFDSVDDPDDL